MNGVKVIYGIHTRINLDKWFMIYAHIVHIVEKSTYNIIMIYMDI